MIQAFLQSGLCFERYTKKYLLSFKLMAAFAITFFNLNTDLYAHKHFNTDNFRQSVTINSNAKYLLSGWIYDKTVGNVDCYYKLSDCNGTAVVFLKFVNNNKFNVKILWKELFTTRQVPSKTEGIKGEKKLILPPGETSSTSCTATTNKDCIILPQQAITAYRADILQFEFKDIIVNPS